MMIHYNKGSHKVSTYNRPRLLTAYDYFQKSVTCRSKSKMAAIQGKNIRSGIGKTLFF